MRIFLDANAVIYLVECVDPWYDRVREVMSELMEKHGRGKIVVSALSLLECKVKPLRDNDTSLLQRYKTFFTSSGLCIQPLDNNVIEHAAMLRAHHRLSTPDAIQAASALADVGNMVFVTGDPVFSKVDALETICLL